MKTFCNDQAKPLLKFFTKTKSELVNLKLKQILNEGFISKPQGIFLKAAIRKRQKFEQNKTQNEWSLNEIVVFESEYESTNSAHIKIYAKRENDEILLYKDRIGGYKTEALIVYEVASSSQDT